MLAVICRRAGWSVHAKGRILQWSMLHATSPGCFVPPSACLPFSLMEQVAIVAAGLKSVWGRQTLSSL